MGQRRYPGNKSGARKRVPGLWNSSSGISLSRPRICHCQQTTWPYKKQGAAAVPLLNSRAAFFRFPSTKRDRLFKPLISEGCCLLLNGKQCSQQAQTPQASQKTSLLVTLSFSFWVKQSFSETQDRLHKRGNDGTKWLNQKPSASHGQGRVKTAASLLPSPRSTGARSVVCPATSAMTLDSGAPRRHALAMVGPSWRRVSGERESGRDAFCVDEFSSRTPCLATNMHYILLRSPHHYPDPAWH